MQNKETKMAGLKTNHRKRSEEKLVFTNYTRDGNRIISDKNGIAEVFSTFFMNIGPNLANKIPQVCK